MCLSLSSPASQPAPRTPRVASHGTRRRAPPSYREPASQPASLAGVQPHTHTHTNHPPTREECQSEAKDNRLAHACAGLAGQQPPWHATCVRMQPARGRTHCCTRMHGPGSGPGYSQPARACPAAVAFAIAAAVACCCCGPCCLGCCSPPSRHRLWEEGSRTDRPITTSPRLRGQV